MDPRAARPCALLPRHGAAPGADGELHDHTTRVAEPVLRGALLAALAG